MASAVKVFCTGYPSLDHLARVRSMAGMDETHIIEQPWGVPTFGGCAANVAVGLARLGVPTGIGMSLGDDPEGKAFLEHLQRNGVDTAGIVIDHGRTARSYFFLDHDGRYYLFFDPGTSRDWCPRAWDFQGAAWAQLTVVSQPAALSFAELAARAGVRLVWQLKKDREAFPPDVVRTIFPLCSIAIMNRAESRYVQECLGLQSEAEMLSAGPTHVVVTHGKDGAVIWGPDGPIHVPAVPTRVVDATGAGDAFTAGFLWGLARDWDVKRAGRAGATVASFVVETPGAQEGLPREAEVRRRYRQTFGEELPA